MTDRHRNSETGLREAVALAALFALVKFAIHLATNLYQPHIGWGYFRDELYYIACGQHLAWGYVDHAPMVALQARLALLLFGKSLAGIRMFSALAGAGRIFLTGILCWRLGGGRAGQALAMLGVLLAPQYLGTDSYLSMNSFESLFWIAALLAILQVQRSAASHDLPGVRAGWILFGIAAGLGLENKHTMTFFLVALAIGLFLSAERRLLLTRQAAVGVGILLVLAAPNLIWQITHHFPTLEFLLNGVREHKNVALPPLQFVVQQAMMLNPLSAVLWLGGLSWLLFSARSRAFRWMGFTYVIFLALMLVLHAKDYYVAPIYPMLFAAGGVSLLQPFKTERNRWLRPSVVAAYALVLLAMGIVISPAAIPVFRPEKQLAYLERMHLEGKPDEKWSQGPMKQFYSDRFGWQEMANAVTQVYNTLSPADQARVGIWGANYGDASAINFLAPRPANGSRLPVAVSGQNAYWMWGPHGYSGEVMILATSATLADVRETYDEVTIAARADSAWAMPYERINIYLVRHRKANFSSEWPEMKMYI